MIPAVARTESTLGRWRTKLLKRIEPYILLAPALVFVVSLCVYPLVRMIQMSTHSMRFGESLYGTEFVGLANYAELLTSDGFWHSAKLSLVFTIVCLGTELILGMAIALLLNQKIAGRSLITACLIIPMVLMPSMVGMTWRLYFSFHGIVNWFIEVFGGTPLNWFSPELALPAAMIVDIWESTPFFILVLLAGLQSLPRDPFDAARVDGASPWQVLRYLILPMMGPLIIITSLLRLMDLMRLFDVIFTMFGGGPGNATETLPLNIYVVTSLRRNVGLGMAGSVMLILVTLVAAVGLVILLRRMRGVES